MNRSSESVSITSLSSPERRKIKFKPTLQIREYVNENTELDKARMFYTEEEYYDIEESNTEVVEMMIQSKGNGDSPKKKKKNSISLSHIERTLGDSGRGLEKMTPDEWDRTQDRREAACHAVFREQARQQQQSICDPHAISKVYVRASARSKDEATDAALLDERFIRKEFGPLEPTGIKRMTPENEDGKSIDASASASSGDSSTNEKSSSRKDPSGQSREIRPLSQGQRRSSKPDPP
ncbi:MAG: hypothetical protein SGILL_003432 [Bacillariaceae sp.]